MLEVEDLSVSYGKIRAVKGVNLRVERGEIVSLIGANGAGKTSILNSIMGIIPSKGRIVFEGVEITRLKPWKRAKMGMSLVPERARVFQNMTVYENLEIGGHGLSRAEFRENLRVVYDIFPRLAERRKQLAMTLSGGEKQMLAIARSLMTKPKFMLVDEISLGLMPKLVDEIFQTLVNLKDMGITLLISEQNTKKALEISTRAYVIQNGLVFKEGYSKDLIEDEDVKRAYLGIEA